MKALSIQQPWAWAIVVGGKDIENRDWYTNIRGRILVHCGKQFDFGAVAFLEEMGLHVPSDLPTGGIVGSIEIIDCVNKHDSKWFFGEYGFVLKNPVVLPFTSYRGQLGFFEITDGEFKC
jgi:hypothetical protein